MSGFKGAGILRRLVFYALKWPGELNRRLLLLSQLTEPTGLESAPATALLERRSTTAVFAAEQSRRHMPRFFFNTTCADRAVTDVAGEDCRTLEEARRRARELASELARSQLSTGQAPTGWVEVEDEQHRSLFMVPFSSIAS